MSSLILPGRFTRQPKSPVRLDLSNQLIAGLTELVLPPFHSTVVRGYRTQVPAGTVTTVAGSAGVGFKNDGVTNGNGTQICNLPMDLLRSTTDITVFVVRRSVDTTARAASLFGYNVSGSERIFSHAPYADGNLYWDFGNSTAGSGRVSVAFTKSLLPEALIFIAGGGKGREVWRNGTRIALNTSATASNTTTGFVNFKIGGFDTSTPSDLDEVYLFGVANRAWSDAEAREWSRNPWQLVRESGTRFFLPGASIGGSGARPQVFVST